MQQVLSTLVVASDADELPEMERLADAVSQLTGEKVSCTPTADIARARADFVLANLDMRPGARIASLTGVEPGRLVLIGVDRAAIADLLRRFDLLAIVEYGAWRRWLREPDARGVLFGLRSLGVDYKAFMEIGVTDYVGFDGGRMNLPELIVDYLSRVRARR